MNAAILAAIIALTPGFNQGIPAAGQVAAVQVVTQSAAPTVALKTVSTARTWTNALETVVSKHVRYDFAVTNFDGNAAIPTNTVDHFDYADWIVNGTNFIVGKVTASAFLATNVVETGGKILAAEYTVTNDLASVTASAHYGVDSPDSATFYFGDPIIVTGATDGDVVKLILK